MMHAPTKHFCAASAQPQRRALHEPLWVRVLIRTASLSFLGIFLLLPLVTVFYEALREGVGAYLASFRDPAALSEHKAGSVRG